MWWRWPATWSFMPGLLELAHKPDEYVEISAMERSARVMAGALERLLT